MHPRMVFQSLKGSFGQLAGSRKGWCESGTACGDRPMLHYDIGSRHCQPLPSPACKGELAELPIPVGGIQHRHRDSLARADVCSIYHLDQDLLCPWHAIPAHHGWPLDHQHVATINDIRLYRENSVRGGGGGGGGDRRTLGNGARFCQPRRPSNCCLELMWAVVLACMGQNRMDRLLKRPSRPDDRLVPCGAQAEWNGLVCLFLSARRYLLNHNVKGGWRFLNITGLLGKVADLGIKLLLLLIADKIKLFVQLGAV
eukprot:jgi/Mesvir1/19755/Mv25377-RA.1